MKAFKFVAVLGLSLVPAIASAQQPANSGLLGKQYLSGAYLQNGVDDPLISNFDDSLTGFEIEFNQPLTWLNSDALAADIFVNYRSHELGGTFGGVTLDSDIDTIDFGARLFANTNSQLRPYITLGATTMRSTSRRNGSVVVSDSETDFLLARGGEYAATANLSLRSDQEIETNDFQGGSQYEGTAALWLTENVFLRGGISVPFGDGLEPGGIIGGGISF